MKHFLSIILLCCFFNGVSQSLKEFTKSFERNGLINDFAGMLNPTEEMELEKKIMSMEKEYEVESVICIIDSLNGLPIKKVATKFGNSWNVGEQSEQKGVLFLISEKDKKVFIATSTGIKEHLQNEKLQRIVDEFIIPHLKNEQYYYALSSGLEAVEKTIKESSLLNDNTFGKLGVLGVFIVFLSVGCFIIYDYYKLGGFDPETRKYGRFRNGGIGFGSGGASSGFGGGFDGSGAGGSFGGDGGGGDGGGD